MSWQPISDQAKSGDWVLLGGGMVDEDHYLMSDSDSISICSRPSVARFSRATKEWQVGYWDGDWRTVYTNPTHWMPLELPALSGKEDVE